VSKGPNYWMTDSLAEYQRFFGSMMLLLAQKGVLGN
jgi:hypothetical protein